jgi:hypothetical protein
MVGRPQAYTPMPMPVNRGPSFARYYSAIARAAALEAAAAEARKKPDQDGELPQAKAWRPPPDLGPDHRQGVA